MILSEIPKSYVTTIRVDLRDIAKVALFLKDNDCQIVGKSKSKLASVAIRVLAEHLGKYTVDKTEDAVGILRAEGYGESAIPGRRDFVPLLKQMAKESLSLDSGMPQTEVGANFRKEVEALKATQVTKPSKADYDAAAESGLLTPEPDPEPQRKARTSDDETVDINRLRAGLSGAPSVEDGEVE